MNIRIDVIGSVRTAARYFGEWTRPYHNSRPLVIMATSPVWSALS